MSDSSTTLTIGEEEFPVVDRQPSEEKCLASPSHRLYLVQVEDGRKFEVCDECHSSKLIEAPAVEPEPAAPEES